MDRSTRRPYLLFPKLGPAGSRGALPSMTAPALEPKTIAPRRSPTKKPALNPKVEPMYDPAELSRAGVTAEEFHSVKAFVVNSHKDRVHREATIKMQKLLVEVRMRSRTLTRVNDHKNVVQARYYRRLHAARRITIWWKPICRVCIARRKWLASKPSKQKMDAAATTIQLSWHLYKLKEKPIKVQFADSAKPKLLYLIKRYRERKHTDNTRAIRVAIHLQAMWRGVLARRTAAAIKRRIQHQHQMKIHALKLQAVWRGFCARRRYAALRIYNLAAIRIQAIFRGWLMYSRYQELKRIGRMPPHDGVVALLQLAESLQRKWKEIRDNIELHRHQLDRHRLVIADHAKSAERSAKRVGDAQDRFDHISQIVSFVRSLVKDHRKLHALARLVYLAVHQAQDALQTDIAVPSDWYPSFFKDQYKLGLLAKLDASVLASSLFENIKSKVSAKTSVDSIHRSLLLELNIDLAARIPKEQVAKQALDACKADGAGLSKGLGDAKYAIVLKAVDLNIKQRALDDIEDRLDRLLSYAWTVDALATRAFFEVDPGRLQKLLPPASPLLLTQPTQQLSPQQQKAKIRVKRIVGEVQHSLDNQMRTSMAPFMSTLTIIRAKRQQLTNGLEAEDPAEARRLLGPLASEGVLSPRLGMIPNAFPDLHSRVAKRKTEQADEDDARDSAMKALRNGEETFTKNQALKASRTETRMGRLLRAAAHARLAPRHVQQFMSGISWTKLTDAESEHFSQKGAASEREAIGDADGPPVSGVVGRTTVDFVEPMALGIPSLTETLNTSERPGRRMATLDLSSSVKLMASSKHRTYEDVPEKPLLLEQGFPHTFGPAIDLDSPKRRRNEQLYVLASRDASTLRTPVVLRSVVKQITSRSATQQLKAEDSTNDKYAEHLDPPVPYMSAGQQEAIARSEQLPFLGPMEIAAELDAEQMRSAEVRPFPSDIMRYSLDDVGWWLAKIGLGRYRPQFAAAGIHGEILANVNADDLVKGLGVIDRAHINIMLRERDALMSESALTVLKTLAHTGGEVAVSQVNEQLALRGPKATVVFRACMAGNLSVLRAALLEGFDANVEDAEGNSMLIMAVKHGHKRIIDELITRGCDLNHQNIDGQCALHFCMDPEMKRVCDPDGSIAKYLVMHGAHQELQNKFGLMPAQGLRHHKPTDGFSRKRPKTLPPISIRRRSVVSEVSTPPNELNALPVPDDVPEDTDLRSLFGPN